MAEKIDATDLVTVASWILTGVDPWLPQQPHHTTTTTGQQDS